MKEGVLALMLDEINYSKYIEKNSTTIFENLIVKDDPKQDHNHLQGLTWDRDNRNYVKEFHLNKRLSYNLVLGYDSLLRQKVVDEDIIMGSKNIADLTGKEHHVICKDIRSLVIRLLGGKNVVDVPEDISYSKHIQKNAVTIFENLVAKDERNSTHQVLQGLTWERDNTNNIKAFKLNTSNH